MAFSHCAQWNDVTVKSHDQYETSSTYKDRKLGWMLARHQSLQSSIVCDITSVTTQLWTSPAAKLAFAID